MQRVANRVLQPRGARLPIVLPGMLKRIQDYAQRRSSNTHSITAAQAS
jgi:hypothetical protein